MQQSLPGGMHRREEAGLASQFLDKHEEIKRTVRIWYAIAAVVDNQSGEPVA